MKKITFLITVVALSTINVFSQHSNKTQSLITIHDAWIRPAAAKSNSALFFEVVNNGGLPDTLLYAKCNFSEIVELHETYKRENDMMGMRQVHKVAIPAQSKVIFKPRSLHIMLIGLQKDVRIGEQYKVTLVFKNAGTIKLKAIVRDMP